MILSEQFLWAGATDLKMVLVDEQEGRYSPSENDPYGTIEAIVDVEATVDGYARQTITGANASTSFISHDSKALLDDVTFPALGAPGDRIAGAWIIHDPDDDDETADPLAFLDLQDEDDLGTELTGGDFVVHFTGSALFTVSKA